MIVLDTNVVSALMQTPQDAAIVAWLNRQPGRRSGSHPSPSWKSVSALNDWRKAGGATRLKHAFADVLRDDLEGRVLGFGDTEARHAATLMAQRHAAGRPAGVNDGMIAGIVLAHRATLATRNVRHFQDAGIRLVDPWAA